MVTPHRRDQPAAQSGLTANVLAAQARRTETGRALVALWRSAASAIPNRPVEPQGKSRTHAQACQQSHRYKRGTSAIR